MINVNKGQFNFGCKLHIRNPKVNISKILCVLGRINEQKYRHLLKVARPQTTSLKKVLKYFKMHFEDVYVLGIENSVANVFRNCILKAWTHEKQALRILHYRPHTFEIIRLFLKAISFGKSINFSKTQPSLTIFFIMNDFVTHTLLVLSWRNYITKCVV